MIIVLIIKKRLIYMYTLNLVSLKKDFARFLEAVIAAVIVGILHKKKKK